MATKPGLERGGKNKWPTVVGLGPVYHLLELIIKMCCPTASKIKNSCSEWPQSKQKDKLGVAGRTLDVVS